MKKRWGVIVFYLFIVISLISCDLFTGPKVDLFQIISDEVDWANAARLTVTVEFPLEWGSSPQRGEGKCGDTRKGYEFGVEFTPMSSYGFEKWLAVPTSAYAALDKTKSASEIESDGDTLNNVVTITESVSDTGAKTAKVKINTTEPVTLVPWCSERPKITMSNPPLINTGVSYNRGQQIKIWFSTDLQADTVKFAQDFITITGIKTDGTGEPYNENGENGDLAVFYNTPIYEISTRTITIMPSDPPPPGELMITVTVGTGVWGSNGNGMVSAVSFAYRTNAMMSRNSYNAENVWAIHKPLDAPAAEKFFYREAPTNRDRRLVKNGNDKYEVTVYFGVSRSGEVSEPTPDRLKIAEVYYANLSGGESNSLTKETAAVFANADGGSGADYIYRQGKTTTLSYYKTTYVWETPPEPGIIRLVLMPWRETIESVDPDSWRNAVAEGRFVDVVLDNQPPGGNASLTLGGQASVTNGVYNFNSTNNTLNVTGDFTGIADNAGFGIRHIAASMDKPWTMDEQSTLQWCYRIIDEGANPTSTESEWYDLDSATRTQNLTSLTSSTINRNIQVKYRDSLGNESEWSSSMGKIRYYNSARDVWAIHSATTSSVATDFFYQGADLARDRRLKGSSSTSNQVTLFFYIPGTGSTMPDKVRIAEINYAALNGNDKNELVRERDFTPTKFTSGTGANSVYMSGKPAASAATYYSVDYTWTSTYPATAGIIRLAVMPYSGTFNSNADSWQTAVEEGRFVTVVFDNLPPGGTANFSLSGESWRNGNVYTYNPASKSLTITPNLSGITDNSGVGIPLEAATQNKPWTMDNWANLQWQYRIVNEGDPTVALITSGWYSFSTDGTAVTRDLSAATALAYSSLVRDIHVHYRDKTNTTTTTSAWSSSVGKIRYNNSAGNVWAIHTGVTATGEANFFYQGAPTDRDRRLKKNGSNYEVIIYFSIPSTTTLPERLRIAEINYATLNGNENTLNDTSIKTRDYTSLTQASGTSGTDYYYKQNVATGMTYYKVTYTGTTSYLTTPGIIRLAVMPYRTGETFTDTWQTAVEEGRFVTVVIDNLAPGGGSASITTSGEVLKTTDNVPVYNSNSKIVTVNASLLGVTDNNGSSGIIGITKDTATQNKPWTMDNQENISWRFGIFTAGSSATPLITSDYKLLNATDPLTITRDLSAATALGNSTATREIRLQYKDSIGNESAWASSSIVGKLIYNTATFGDTVSTWTATYNESGNSISLTWTRPTNATIQVWVNGVLHGSGTTATAASPYRISNIPHIIDSGVRSGQAVSNVMEYNISLNPIYSNGTATPTTFKIWNIPDPTTTSKGMTVSNSNQAVELTQNNFTNTTLTDNLSKILVLTGDVNVSAWTPPSSNFTGKFYGNGHTITINGISGTATNSGLFGVANNALIRDLTVEYADMSLSGATSTTYVGGITGQATGSTQILNCIVRGASTTNKLTVTANAQTYMGGVVSYMGGNSFIQNCRAALNVTLSNGSSNNVFFCVGGVVGYSQSTGTSEKITSLGTVSMEKTNGESDSNYCGGIAGFLQYTKFTDCVFSGQISLSNFNASGTTYIGGVMGYYSTSGTADNCSATGNIMVNYAGSGAVYLGGIAGVFSGNSASNIVYFKNSTFKDGAISLETTGTSNCYVGGFSGAIYNYTDIKYCHSKALSVTAWSTGTSTNAIMAGGGFSGLMRQASISDCSSSSPVTIPSLHTSPCGVLAGGFTAAFENAGVKSSMTRCYATGDLIVYCGYKGATTRGSGNYIGGLVGFSYNTSSTATSPNTINQCYAAGKITAVNNGNFGNMYFGVGGLVGGAEYTDISECYATGSVTARKGQNVQTPVVVGGLVGFLGGGYSSSGHSYNAPLSSITDCYALGDVTADNPNSGGPGVGINGNVYAGGLVGYAQIDASKTITRSFAGGNVTAKNNNAITYGNTYAGGVMGYMETGGLNNTAHIGRNRSGNLVIIITQGGSNSSAGRIYAQSGEATPSGNYAYEGLFVGTNSSYYLYQTTAEVLDRIAPTMDLSPHVSNTLNNAYIVFGAGTIRDSGGSGLALASTTITVVSNPTGMGGSPTFNSSYNDMNNIGRIENIDLSGLGTTTTNYLQLNITIKDNAGNTANYLIQVNPNTSGSAFPFNFTCTFKPQGSTIANEPKHGTNITNVQLSDSTFWTDTLLFNSATGGGNTSAWNFAPIAQGWPVLANAGGQQ